MFTCDDGTCLDLKKRCDNIFDCIDGSDESNCERLLLDKKNYIQVFPPFIKSEKSKISVEIDIQSIKNIDELAMSFNAEVSIYIQWKDPR